MPATMLYPARLRPILSRTLACMALMAPCAAALAESSTNAALEPARSPLAPDVRAALSEILNDDPFRPAGTTEAPRSPLRVRPSSPGPLDWKRVEKLDGSSAVSVKKELSTAWEAKLGADFDLAAGNDPIRQPLPSLREPNTGAAWAKIRVPGVAMVDARLEPSPEQQTFGTTVSRSLSLGHGYSLTLQNTYTLTERAQAVTPPVTGGPTSAASPAHVVSNDRMVKFSIQPTGTTFAVGTTSSSADSTTRSKLGAEQKLFEHFHVTATVTDVGAASSNKSVTAGFKWQW